MPLLAPDSLARSLLFSRPVQADDDRRRRRRRRSRPPAAAQAASQAVVGLCGLCVEQQRQEALLSEARRRPVQRPHDEPSWPLDCRLDPPPPRPPAPPPHTPAPRKHTTKSPIVKKPAGPARKISALPRVKPGPELLHKVLVTSNGVPVVVTDVSSVDATSCLGRARHFSPEYGFERAARATSYDLRQMAKAGAGLLDDAQFAHEHDRNHVRPSKVRLLLGDCEYIDEAHEFAIDLARAAAA